MTDWRVRLATQWTGAGTPIDSYHYLLVDEYGIIRGTDKTAQVMNQPGKRPKPNTYIIEAEMTEAVYTALEGDNQYLVFSAEEILEDAS